ncbi:MAG: phenylalanine--tRNA ligase subunit beta [Calditrichaeota bacterium]|nr:phenylalanine--tRNA ligase subunit beta [Calditrichota bacterium]
MKFSYNWLRDLVPFDQSPEALADILTSLGHAVDGIDTVGAAWTGIVVGKVLECAPIEGSDHLSLCRVEAGRDEALPVVCGAPNVAAGQTIAFALPGARLPGGFEITSRKVRGVLSHGMICSERELGLSDEHKGILVLPNDLPVGTPLEEHLAPRDWVFDIDITFNRPDCLSHLGIARELSAKLRISLNLPLTGGLSRQQTNDVLASGALGVGSLPLEIRIEDTQHCPRYTARLVEDVTVASAPLWMQDRLRAVGLRPINNIVDITNFLLHETGHPLHAFDYRLIEQGRVIVRNAAEGERFTTLDGRERLLTAEDLLIADPVKGIALAGVMGGLNSEINDATRDVLIECAVFEPTGIRRTSQRLGLVSDSSRRFERGVDPDATPYVAARAAWLMAELAGGRPVEEALDVQPAAFQPRLVSFRPSRGRSLLTLDLDDAAMASHLKALGCEVESQSSGDGTERLSVTVPSWRHDLNEEADLIEEVARLEGYDAVVPAVRSQLPLVRDPAQDRSRRRVSQIKHAMVQLGLREAIPWTLVPVSDGSGSKANADAHRLINPISDDLAFLRASLLPGLLQAAVRNFNQGHRMIRLFEWGRTFEKAGNDSTRPVERLKLGIILAGYLREKSWGDAGCNWTIHHVKGLALDALRLLDVDNVSQIDYLVPEGFSTGATLSRGETGTSAIVGHYGALKADLARRFDADFPVWYVEFEGEPLLGASPIGTTTYHPLPRYPAVLRDLALVVEKGVPAGRVEDLLQRTGGELIVGARLFDLFEGGGVGDSRKSLAFHLIFRSHDRTLTDGEVDKLVNGMVAAAKLEFAAELRG